MVKVKHETIKNLKVVGLGGVKHEFNAEGIAVMEDEQANYLKLIPGFKVMGTATEKDAPKKAPAKAVEKKDASEDEGKTPEPTVEGKDNEGKEKEGTKGKGKPKDA